MEPGLEHRCRCWSPVCLQPRLLPLQDEQSESPAVRGYCPGDVSGSVIGDVCLGRSTLHQNGFFQPKTGCNRAKRGAERPVSRLHRLETSYCCSSATARRKKCIQRRGSLEEPTATATMSWAGGGPGSPSRCSGPCSRGLGGYPSRDCRACGRGGACGGGGASGGGSAAHAHTAVHSPPAPALLC